MKKQTSLSEDIWKQSKPAWTYPRNWYVIPALDVNDLIRQRVEELKEQINDFNETSMGDERRINLVKEIFGDKLC